MRSPFMSLLPSLNAAFDAHRKAMDEAEKAFDAYAAAMRANDGTASIKALIFDQAEGRARLAFEDLKLAMAEARSAHKESIRVQ